MSTVSRYYVQVIANRLKTRVEIGRVYFGKRFCSRSMRGGISNYRRLIFHLVRSCRAH